jgi:hypothetical protein
MISNRTNMNWLNSSISVQLRHRGAAASLLLMILIFGGCATYHVGNQFLFRNDIRSIHVEMFESNSFRRFLGQRLTEAVIKEIELSTPLVISEPQLAHSFLRGRILTDIKNPRGETFNDDVRVLDNAWTIEVTWTDRAGVPLMQRQVLKIRREGILIPEGGQSLSTTQQSIIEQFARDIVNQMEQSF